MNILVTNDDGINAEGIHRLAEALTDVGAVYISAPSSQKSACGHGISIEKPITFEEVAFAKVVRAFSVGGTPVDCVKIGIAMLEKEGIVIDSVFSGINHGSNLGTDTLYSGTVSAAVEGAMIGKRSVAVSIGSRKPQQFDSACELAVYAANLSPELHLPGTTLSINVPNLPAGEIRGLRVTRLGIREYDEWFHEDEDSKKEAERTSVHSFKYGGRPIFRAELAPDIDIAAHNEGFATITALHYDLTDHEMLSRLRQAGMDSSNNRFDHESSIDNKR